MGQMRTRTAYCPHGFFIPGRPEPWTVPAKGGGAELKASRFCLKCWEEHGETFLRYKFEHIEAEEPCQFGFLDLIHAVLKAHAYYRDQDRFEFLETELRLHLISKEAQFANKPRAYIREALKNRLIDLQRDDKSEFQIEKTSDAFDEAIPLSGMDDDDLQAAIVSAVDSEQTSIEDAREATASQLIEAAYNSVRLKDPQSRRSRTPQQENAELIRRAIDEQGHRLDVLTQITQKEKEKAVWKARRELMAAINTLPTDEQTVMRMRFLDGNELRDGRPRSRRDILRELRINGNGGSRWTEWELRTLEQKAVLRLRGKVTLPAIFKHRD